MLNNMFSPPAPPPRRPSLHTLTMHEVIASFFHLQQCSKQRLPQIWHDMYGVESRGVLPFPKAPLLASPPPPPREVVWKVPQELMKEVMCAGKDFGEACEGYTLDAVEFRDFGKNSCKVCFCKKKLDSHKIETKSTPRNIS